MNTKKASAPAAAAGMTITRKNTSIIMSISMKNVPAAAGMSTMIIIVNMGMKLAPAPVGMSIITIIMMNVAAAAVMIMDTCRLMTAKR